MPRYLFICRFQFAWTHPSTNMNAAACSMEKARLHEEMIKKRLTELSEMRRKEAVAPPAAVVAPSRANRVQRNMRQFERFAACAEDG